MPLYVPQNRAIGPGDRLQPPEADSHSEAKNVLPKGPHPEKKTDPTLC